MRQNFCLGNPLGENALSVTRAALSFWIRHEAPWLVFDLKRGKTLFIPDVSSPFGSQTHGEA